MSGGAEKRYTKQLRLPWGGEAAPAPLDRLTQRVTALAAEDPAALKLRRTQLRLTLKTTRLTVPGAHALTQELTALRLQLTRLSRARALRKLSGGPQ